MFDDPAALQKARSAVIDAGLATPAAMAIEPDSPLEEISDELLLALVDRLKQLLPSESEDARGAYAEAVRRGGQLLIVTVPEEDAPAVRQILRENGAVDMERRVKQSSATGWLGFELPPSLPEMVFDEPEAEPRVCIDERGGTETEDRDEGKSRTIRLFDQTTGQELGRISEVELKVLQDALEDEDPNDNEYWINPAEIDDLACRPGATRHLISVLRAAVADKPDGVDIAFQREGEPCQNLRGPDAGPGRGNCFETPKEVY
jgi:hypothetical protein